MESTACGRLDRIGFVPAPLDIQAGRIFELPWQVFGGDAHEIYLARLKAQCQRRRAGDVGRPSGPPTPAAFASGDAVSRRGELGWFVIQLLEA